MTLQEGLKRLFNETSNTDISTEELTKRVTSMFINTLDKFIRFKGDDHRGDVYIDMFTSDIEKPVLEFTEISGDDSYHTMSDFFNYVLNKAKPVKINNKWLWTVNGLSGYYTIEKIYEDYLKTLRPKK